jgi:hypothetical protein
VRPDSHDSNEKPFYHLIDDSVETETYDDVLQDSNACLYLYLYLDL